MILGIAVCALGNRTWGYKPWAHLIGIAIMTFGVVLIQPNFWQWILLIFGTLLLFRDFTSAPWLNETHGTFEWAGVARAALILPYVGLLCYLDRDITHLIVGACFPIIPLFYYFAGKLTQKYCVELAELLTGAYIGLIAIQENI